MEDPVEQLKHTVEMHGHHLRRHDADIAALGGEIRGLSDRVETVRAEVLNAFAIVTAFMTRVEIKMDAHQHMDALLILLVVVLLGSMWWFK